MYTHYGEGSRMFYHYHMVYHWYPLVTLSCLAVYVELVLGHILRHIRRHSREIGCGCVDEDEGRKRLEQLQNMTTACKWRKGGE